MQVNTYDVHFAAIRKALKNGNAAVMVGAGFSRNARNGEQLATWSELSGELWKALNPDEPPLSSFSTSVVTQLGEQYARVFSKPALEEVLKRLIPDERVHPGALHAQLLELPWVDIFTTNYDTLLERAAEKIVDRAHYTVTCREDIPQSKILNRRRIVKLHGSFPSQRPFIFTEDEYRRYPADFAPLVNLVRQSLLENVFCLVGFSGDDPNFLHWIGWVRDMLDQHALPIYLLLDKRPSLGQQKLLDARQVTPIVLPLPPGIDSDDYPARLQSFFRAIDPTQEPQDTAWGSDAGPDSDFSVSKSMAERKAAVIAAYERLGALRKTYPGWLVAPQSVRQRLEHTVGYGPAFADREALLSVLQDDAYVAALIMAEYSWYQDVVLQSMDDQLAAEARKILLATADVNTHVLQERSAILQRLGAASVREYRDRWKALALALLLWTREGLHREAFEEIQRLLNISFPDDSQLEDEIAHQAVLLSLYEGERVAALRLLNEWEVKSADGYMLVRKGSLLSELGEVERGFSISLSGLQQLRWDQRSRSDITRYLSEEAWACAVIGRQQNAMASPFRRSEPGHDTAQIAAQLFRRLIDLAAKGVDVTRELDLLDASLDAEAATPSDPKSVVPGFDLGSYTTSTTIGAPGRVKEKLDAAFAWLTLADRVSLVPRIGNFSFGINSFLCAGWWVQYADSMQRVLSVLVRTMSTTALEPRRPVDPRHTAGWLSRFQVGKTDESLAIRICETSLSLIERVLLGELSNNAEQTLAFHIQVFGRLVLRVSNISQVEAYANRIVSIHQRETLAEYPRLWRHFATALSRCFEAMSPAKQKQLLPSIWKIANRPLVAQPHFLDDWVPLSLFNPNINPLPASDADAAIPPNIDELILKIDQPRTWEYIYLLQNWALLTEAHRKIICQKLWNKTDGTWPVLEGFYPEATYVWGRPNDDVDHHKVFREWILERIAPNFPSQGSIVSIRRPGRRAWGLPVNNVGLRALVKSFEREPWPLDDARRALAKIKAWWQHDWPEISSDVQSVDDLASELLQRLDYIDSFFALVISNKSLNSLLDEAEFLEWIEQMLVATQPYGASFSRFRIAKASAHGNSDALWQVVEELVVELADPDISIAARSAPKVVAYWLSSLTPEANQAFQFLVVSIAGFIAARRMPILPWMLQTATEIVHHRPDLLDGQALSLIEVGLSKMQHELSYKARKEGSGIPDDNVPIIRFQCARLARAMRERLQRSSACINDWIDASINDPLPEMRFLPKQPAP